MKPIVLASSSPRRKRLLEQAGIPFIVDPSNLDEDSFTIANPRELVTTLAREKAKEVGNRHPNSIIIGADTTVVCQGMMLAKPVDVKDARRMLKLLSGKRHSVITGYAIIDTETNKEVVGSVESSVYFKNLAEKQINDYIETGGPFDKAGSYGAQEGLSKEFVERIEGDYDNVVGLPVKRIVDVLTNPNQLKLTLTKLTT